MAAFKAWWERWPLTYEREIAGYAECGLNFVPDHAVVQAKGIMVFRGSVTAAAKQWNLEVIYPSGFPYVRPEVICAEARLARHQHPIDRNLCLFASDDSEWTTANTGAQLVQQAVVLLETSAAGPEAVAEREVDAPEPASFYYEYSRGRSLLFLEEPPPTLRGQLGEFTVAQYELPAGDAHAVLMDVTLEGKSLWKISADLVPNEELRTIRGVWVRCNEAPPAARQDRTAAQYEDFKVIASAMAPKFDYRLKKLQQNRIDAFALVFDEEGPKRNEWHENWLLCTQSEGKLPEVWRTYRWTVADRFQRIPTLSTLTEKRVLLLGLGAIGSSVAISLARTGLGNFCLVDSDIVEPGPLVRQVYRRQDIGLPKALAIARYIKDISPSAKVSWIHGRVGGAPTNLAKVEQTKDQLVDLVDQLPNVDLLISASGLNSIDLVINELGASLKVPRIFGWVTNGAWGGRVFRARSGEACFECLTHAIHRFPTPQSDDTAAPIFARGCALPTFTGTGFDAEAVANLMTRLVIQTLTSGNNPSYPDNPSNLITWNSRGKLAGNFPSIEHHLVERQPKCVACTIYP